MLVNESGALSDGYDFKSVMLLLVQMENLCDCDGWKFRLFRFKSR